MRAVTLSQPGGLDRLHVTDAPDPGQPELLALHRPTPATLADADIDRFMPGPPDEPAAR